MIGVGPLRWRRVSVTKLARDWGMSVDEVEAVAAHLGAEAVVDSHGERAYRGADLVDAARALGADAPIAETARRARNGWLIASLGALALALAIPALRDSQEVNGGWMVLSCAFLAFLQQRYRLWAQASSGLGLVARELGNHPAPDGSLRRPALATALMPTIAGTVGLVVGVVAFVASGEASFGRDVGIVVWIAVIFLGQKAVEGRLRAGSTTPSTGT